MNKPDAPYKMDHEDSETSVNPGDTAEDNTSNNPTTPVEKKLDEDNKSEEVALTNDDPLKIDVTAPLPLPDVPLETSEPVTTDETRASPTDNIHQEQATCGQCAEKIDGETTAEEVTDQQPISVDVNPEEEVQQTKELISSENTAATPAVETMEVAVIENVTENSVPVLDQNPPTVNPGDPLDVSKTEAVLTSSLALIATYGGMSDDSESDSESSSESSSSSSSSSSDEDDVQVVDTVSYRNTVNVLSSGEDNSGDDSDLELVGVTPGEKKRPKKLIKAKGEMDIIDLPPIEDLNISVPEHECIELGKIMSVVDQLVLVESNLGNIALDLDTVLFLDKGQRTLGRIFDVLGQVNQPIYCVRFNSAEHIQEKEILPGMTVYYNNQRPEHTSVVVLPNLMRMKGSDASWDHDIEPPQGCVEYSDDEEERAARNQRKAANRKPVPEDPSQQRMKRVREPFNRQTRVRNPFAGPRYPHPPPHGARPPLQVGPPPNQWPAPHNGYGSDYGNYSWHTYYQQPPPQHAPPHAPYPPPPYAMPGPFYANPYAQPPGPPPSQGQWGNPGGNYYQNGDPGPSHGRQFKQEKR